MHFQRSLDALLEKILQLSPGEGFFKFSGKGLAYERTIGAAAWPKTGFHLIALDLFLHALEEALLAGAHMLQGHRPCPATVSLFLNAFLTRFLTKKGTRETACFASSVQSTI